MSKAVLLHCEHPPDDTTSRKSKGVSTTRLLPRSMAWKYNSNDAGTVRGSRTTSPPVSRFNVITSPGWVSNPVVTVQLVAVDVDRAETELFDTFATFRVN